MQLCKNCYIPMNGVSSFSESSMERFYKCPKCNKETKHRKLRKDDLNFGEELDKAIHKRK